MRWIIATMLAAAPAMAEPIAVPSGQPVELVEVIRDAPGTADIVWRFRFVAPQIARGGGTVGVDAALADMDALCADVAVPMVEQAEFAPDQVIISFTDRPVAFGSPAPEATQFFEAYRIEAGSCVWEGF